MSGAAPVFGAASPVAAGEAAAWARLSATQDAAEFHAAWLAILCSQIGRVRGAMLLLGREGEAGFGPAAVWPDASRDMHYLAPVAERTLKERRGLVLPAPVDGLAAPGAAGAAAAVASAHIGYPVELAGALHGAVVLDLPATPAADLQRAMRLLHWSSAWLLGRLREQAAALQARDFAQVRLANELLATSLQTRQLGASALAVVNELATRLHCERVSLGLLERGSMALQAISHTATFDRRSALAGQIGDAMDEVLDLASTIVWPIAWAGDANDTSLADEGQLAAMAATAHAALAGQAGNAGGPGAVYSVCSVPIVDAGRTVGAITLERSMPFDADNVALCRAVGLLLGPIFTLKRQAERSLWRRTGDSLGQARAALLGPGHPGAKLIAGVSLLALLVLALADMPYRVSARTVVEGEVQRAAVAPFDGYIAQGLVRAGDTVRLGQPLARLVDRELQLEHTRWTAERELAQRRQRQAAATADRATVAMAGAQVDQAQAQLALVDDKLARATVLAPFDGVVVSGDLTQLQGSPVEQGKLLFEIAPLDRWRLVLEVDERDIGPLRPGQRGQLLLSALPGLPHDTLGFAVQRITPMATAQDGRNFFRVEARLDAPSTRLRPGMEGVGKVAVGQRSVVWVWTHSLTDWVRLAWWKWIP